MWRGWNEIAFLAGYFELASALFITLVNMYQIHYTSIYPLFAFIYFCQFVYCYSTVLVYLSNGNISTDIKQYTLMVVNKI